VFLFYQSGIPEGNLILDEAESWHCVKVLRKKAGKTIHLTDGRGGLYEARITEAQPRACRFEILTRQFSARPPYSISLAVAPAKSGERNDWLAEKAVELGVDKLLYFVSHNSERVKLNKERVERICTSAMKQSLRPWLPSVGGLVSFAEILTAQADQRFIAHAGYPSSLFQVAEKSGSYLVLIGPEGDFTKDELSLAESNGFAPVSLGASRLRTETAALAAVQALVLKNL
jgi:16S rRNA (uracil1498-N3)-methyltransferase